MSDTSAVSSVIDTTQKENAADRLGIQPVGKLLLQFSVPAITGMILNALYNVVDRIFVGRGVNPVAIGGLSLILPVMTMTLAFAMLFGIGTANMISMRLGQKRKQEAENALNHCIILLLITGLLIMAVGLIFMEPILSLLGAQEGSEALNYARDYFKIILFGSAFSTISFGLSQCTRAQGFPLISMLSMVLGAGTNIVLDAVFILIFHWGVKGAAWATIISQLASTIWILHFNLGKKAHIRLNFRSFKPSAEIIFQIMAFGSAQFLLQFVMSGVQLLYNNSMGWYGAASLGVSNGGDIALSGMNIIGAITMLILMPVFGINQGAQPIQGYNYGAKKFNRVLRAYLLAISAATGICIIGFVLCQLFPRQIISLFAPQGIPELMNFTVWSLRVIMICFIFNGFQVVSANFFIVTGRPKISIFLSMLRQCIVLIPCIIIFGKIWGLWGIVAAGPVADGFSLIVTGIMIGFELRKLKQQIRMGF